jgi:hypothetical protein
MVLRFLNKTLDYVPVVLNLGPCQQRLESVMGIDFSVTVREMVYLTATQSFSDPFSMLANVTYGDSGFNVFESLQRKFYQLEILQANLNVRHIMMGVSINILLRLN